MAVAAAEQLVAAMGGNGNGGNGSAGDGGWKGGTEKAMAMAMGEQEAEGGGGGGGGGRRRRRSRREGEEEAEAMAMAMAKKKEGGAAAYWGLMALSSAALVLGLSSATLLGRLYFVNGGSRRWLYTWIECTGWPVLLIPMAISYCVGGRKKLGGAAIAKEAAEEAAEAAAAAAAAAAAPSSSAAIAIAMEAAAAAEAAPSSNAAIAAAAAAAIATSSSSSSSSSRGIALTPKLLLCFLALGSLTALDNLLYSWGLSYLPVSTNSLLCSSQLAFNAAFARLLVGQRVGAHELNAVVVITAATALLAVTAGGDRPAGTTAAQYAAGFVVTIMASAIFALILPLTELLYRRVLGPAAAFWAVIEVQVGVSMVASACSLVGMWAGGDFAALKSEAAGFELGTPAYVATLAFSAVGWQLYVAGGLGLVFLASSLLSCVFMTAMIPALPLLALAFFRDSFTPVKAIAMLLSLWGFLSYLYGAYLHSKRAEAAAAAAKKQQLLPLPQQKTKVASSSSSSSSSASSSSASSSSSPPPSSAAAAASASASMAMTAPAAAAAV